VTESVTISGRGASLHVRRWGEGPPVLAVHGLGFAAGMWGELAARLPGWSVYALDRRHHGQSRAHAQAPCSFVDHAADVEDVVDALGLHGGVGLGHSIGGTDLLLAAGARPDLFSRLLVVEPTAHDPAVPVDPDPTLSILFRVLLDRTRARRASFASLQEARLRVSRTWPRWPAQATDSYLEHALEARADGTLALCCTPAEEAALLEPIFQVMENRYPGTDFAVLPRVGCPVTVLSGGRSEGVYTLMAAIVARVVPGARLEVVPEASHTWAWERPDELARRLL
jgi:pimeloyl-ACP methyl ester carboxylesterase